MIQVNELHKTYRNGRVKALNGVSFSVDKGEIFGVIGPDGAGKSTLFRILASLLIPDTGRGKATVGGYDVIRDYRQIRQIIGYMPGRFSLYQDLSVEENLKFFATLFNTTVEENYSLIKDIYGQIEPFKKRRAGALSGGMKQKLALSCALVHRPKVLILDEPTTGVDPVSRREFWDMLGRLRELGITILVSTAYMDEADRCTRVALAREGEFIAIDTPKGITRDYSEVLWSVEGDRMPALLNRLREYPSVKTAFAFGDKHHITVEKGITTEELENYLANNGFKETRVEAIEPTIEDCFLAM